MNIFICLVSTECWSNSSIQTNVQGTKNTKVYLSCLL